MNQDIERLSQVFADNKELYFSVSYGSDYSIDVKVVEHLSKKSRGEKNFREAIDKAMKFKPDFIIVKTYKWATKQFKQKPESIDRIITKKQQELGGGIGLGMLGGLEGLVSIKTDLSILNAENSRLKQELAQVRTDFTQTKSSKERLQDKNKELEEKIRDLKWENKDTTRNYDSNIESIKRKNEQLDRFITLGGTIIANVAGIGENEIKSLLGLAPETKAIEENTTEENTTEEKGSFTIQPTDKPEARKIAQQIYDAIVQIININEIEEGYNATIKIAQIFNYIVANNDNMNTIYDLITPKK